MRKCVWNWNQLYFYWKTDCGKRWDLCRCNAKELTYCPYCGKKIEEKVTRVNGIAV